MFTRDYTSLEQLEDNKLRQTCILIADYLDITGSAPEREIEEYLQFYNRHIQLYRCAAILTLQEMGYITYSNDQEYFLTEKWKQLDGLGPYYLESADSPRQFNL